MTWKLSRYRTGELVEVCSKEEILATLDGDGCVDGMPFMPEMLQFCGKRFRVSAVAHKTCDTVRKTGGRRLQATVHLANMRCDGSAHGGCQAECNLFWKDEWLKPATDSGQRLVKLKAETRASKGCTEAELRTNTHLRSRTEGESQTYVCQATKLYTGTEPLAWWDIRQYLFDVVTGNHSAGRVMRVLFLASLRWLLAHIPFGWRPVKFINDRMHLWLSGRPSPLLEGQIPDGAPTPTGRLDLKSGECVRIKAKSEIERTVGKYGKNRGLRFDPEEMAPYCGRVVTVRKAVIRIIDEPTGKMLQMKEPCIMLEGVVCNAEYAPCRLNCPRAIPSYWREIWLERVNNGNSQHTESIHPKISSRT
jgi:hypothetical protein